YNTVMGIYGQVPGGMFGADENARQGYIDPRQAAETCSMVEFMHSDEMLLKITGNPIWADRCEEIAFNSLPAAMTPDLKGLHYLTAPNMVQLDRTGKAPMLDNDGNMLSYNPWEYRCCQHNVAFGWPYYAEHLWMATQDNGLAAVFFAASTVKAKVGKGTEVSFVETTEYPFGEIVEFKLSTPEAVTFPFSLRVPSWCKDARVQVNGKYVDVQAKPLSWIVLERSWKNGDVVRLELPQTITVKVWKKNTKAISVNRGPLTYSLKIGERWQRYGGTDEWPAYEVFPTTPWNYGLIVDLKNPSASFEVVKRQGALASQPFTPEAAPIEVRAQGKRISQWKLEANGLIGPLQDSPVRSEEAVEEITLIPMGCARLRVSVFPRISDHPDASVWE
ncbi:MAG: beta-L-arabinofuranosidase domain-containing protein, partial [Bacteroidota bacterium]